MPIALGVASVIGTGISMIQSRNSALAAAADSKAAANSAAATANATADYNARVDRADEAQLALDSATNVRAMRKDASVYLSRQRAAFAGSGVMADSGSPLAVQIETAGRLALREQQAHLDANAKIEHLEANARAGIAEGQSRADAYRIEGQARSDAYHREGTAAVLSGASKMIGQVAGLYNLGAFSGPNKSAGLEGGT